MLSYKLRRPTHIKNLQSQGKSRGRRKRFGESMFNWSLDADYLLSRQDRDHVRSFRERVCPPGNAQHHRGYASPPGNG